MAGTARQDSQRARQIGLLALAASGCASIQNPPGGPPDFNPPIIVSVSPDSGTVVEGFRGQALITFDEVISERSGGGLENLILLSPRPRELKVSWKRTAIGVEPKDGWRSGVPYHLTLLPGIADLRNNRLAEGRTIIFSTGGSIPETSISGTVLDWEEGRVAAQALIEALVLPDSLAYLARTDSAGDFQLTAIPKGTYQVSAFLDGNRNLLRDRREPFDSATVVLDSTLTRTFWTFVHDTVGPRIRTVAQIDSVTIRIQFGQMLDTANPEGDALSVLALPDSLALEVRSVSHQHIYDSLRAAMRAAQDTVERADTIPAVETPAVEPSAAIDTSRNALLLATRPKLGRIWVVELAEPLTPGGRYLITATVSNLAGVSNESRSLLVLAAPQDST